MSLLIIKPGVLTTIQDLGRKGYRRFGVNPNGAMDPAAARLANILVGNDEGEPVLEIHYPAAEIEYEDDTISAVCGADMRPELDGSAVENWRPFAAHKGSVLRFRGKRSGNRSYLACGGGLQVPRWLDSASTNLRAGVGGIDGGRLKAGQRLGVEPTRFDPSVTRRRLSNSLLPAYSGCPTVRIVAGAEFDRIKLKSRESLLQHAFDVTADSDRMGYRLKGGRIELNGDLELISSAVDRGTIQLLPDGQLILLMADHQTTGGYPRVGNVITVDIPLAAQLGGGDKIAFELVSVSEAQMALRLYEYELNRLKCGCRPAGKVL